MNTDESTQAEDDNDYSIYPHMEGIRSSASWILGSYGKRGILTPTMIADLCARFQLPDTIVRTLSVRLGHCLNNDDDIAINLTEIKRSQAINSGQRLLRKLLRQAKAGTLSSPELKEALAPLSTNFAANPDDAGLLPSVITELKDATTISTDLLTTIEQIVRTPGAVAEMTPRDRRVSRDKRRQYVVETCCHAWIDAGRTVTYTTYSDGRADGQRHGPLIDFIQTVVMMITDPSQKLSGETIRADIDHFRVAFLREEQELWAPPKSGNQYT